MAEPRRERKVVTVLFADLVGFTARAETLDPEDVDEVLRPYHEQLRGVLEQWGGTVEKFIGDAVVAVFGAPVAREDDPNVPCAPRSRFVTGRRKRATSRSNRGQHRRGARVARRAPDSGEGFVAGDVVNTAARLQSAAPSTASSCGEQTQRATRQVIDYRDATAIVAKGKSKPVAVWEAVEARSRFAWTSASTAARGSSAARTSSTR
jgi:class 3 adenylate cyclase